MEAVPKDKPKRKPTRIPGYNYSQNGAYFITICAENHRYVFGNFEKKLISNNNSADITGIVGDGVYDIPSMKFSYIGNIVDKYIKFMNEKYDFISVDNYVIMPNHIHLLISVTSEKRLSQAPTPTNNMIPKFISLFKRYCNREIGYNIFQRSYYDHVIRNEKDYLIHYEYIETNPIKWETDDYFIK